MSRRKTRARREIQSSKGGGKQEEGGADEKKQSLGESEDRASSPSGPIQGYGGCSKERSKKNPKELTRTALITNELRRHNEEQRNAWVLGTYMTIKGGVPA